jgi:hypothetical protein
MEKTLSWSIGIDLHGWSIGTDLHGWESGGVTALSFCKDLTYGVAQGHKGC